MGDMVNIPNSLTALRALGIPVFLWFVVAENYAVAVFTLMVAGATDYFDGKLARALGQESRLGELMDPAVDRLYIATVLIAMYITGAIPGWLIFAIVLRDALLGFLLILMKRRKIPPFKVTYLGKAATFNLLYALPLLLLTFASESWIADLSFTFGWAFAGWGIGLYLLTGAQYGLTGLNALRSSVRVSKMETK